MPVSLRRRLILDPITTVKDPRDLSGCQLWLDASRLQIGAAQFTTANSEYLSVADHADLQTGDIDWSVAYWVRSDVIDATARQHVTKWGQLEADREYQIYEISGVVYCDWRLDAVGTSASVSSGATVLSADQWAFVAVWHDAAADTLNMSINNGAVQSVAANGGNAGTATFAIGTRMLAVPGQFMAGRIAKAGFWKRVLSAAEITSLYNSGAGLYYSQLSGSLLTSLMSYWNLNENGGQRNDATANAHHLTDNNTVSAAPSMTPETPADATLVYQWADLSENGRHFSQATQAKKPTYKTGILNGRPVVRFDGTDDLLRLGANLIGGASGTVITVRVPRGGGNGEIISSADEASDNYYLLFRSTIGLNATIRQTNNDVADAVAGNTVIAQDTTYMTLWMSSGTAYSIRINGAAETLSVTSGANTGDWFGDTENRDNMCIGALKRTTEDNPTQLDVAEIIIYDHELTAGEIGRVERYLGRKYGIAVS